MGRTTSYSNSAAGHDPDGDNETSARAARRKAGYVSFELEITFVTTYMILGIENDVLLRGTWIFPSRGQRQIRQTKETHRDGSVTLSEPPTYQKCSYVNQKRPKSVSISILVITPLKKYPFWSQPILSKKSKEHVFDAQMRPKHVDSQ